MTKERIVAISVEGRTEEEFVKRLLAPHLQSYGVYARPIILGGGSKKSGTRSGNVQISRLVHYMSRIYPNVGAVTSLVDFYGFKKAQGRTYSQLEQDILTGIAQKLPSGQNLSRIFPYVQMHEFEALLFSDVSAFNSLPNITSTTISNLLAVRANFSGPEDINNSPITAPSRRIENTVPRYRKVADGAIVAAGIGLPAMRRECPRFDAWVARMEAL